MIRSLFVLSLALASTLSCSNQAPAPAASTAIETSTHLQDTTPDTSSLVATTEAAKPSTLQANEASATTPPSSPVVKAAPSPKSDKKEPTIAISTPKVQSAVPSTSAEGSGIKVVVNQNATATARPAVEKSPTLTNEPTAEAASKVANNIDHSAFDALLQQHVSAKGQVNYTALKKVEGQLDAYLSQLAAAVPNASWAREEALAYWINAYNAATLKLILKNWPTSSITNLHGGKPWDVKWIALGDKTYSLNQIEHDIIRPTFKDARIHFAVNCAAKSCPPLHNRAFTAANLNTSLQKLSRSFINNSQYNEITGSEAQISKLFEWYASDFGNPRTYLNKYLTTPLAEDVSIGYKEYDWALNGF